MCVFHCSYRASTQLLSLCRRDEVNFLLGGFTWIYSSNCWRGGETFAFHQKHGLNVSCLRPRSSIAKEAACGSRPRSLLLVGCSIHPERRRSPSGCATRCLQLGAMSADSVMFRPLNCYDQAHGAMTVRQAGWWGRVENHRCVG